MTDDDTTADDGDEEGTSSDASPATTAAVVDTPAAPAALGGDRDVADVPTGTDTLDGEHQPPLTAESWVVLGAYEGVPDWAVGKPAAVLSFPIGIEEDPQTGTSFEYLPDDALVTVRERSQGATFTLPLKAFSQISRSGGRSAVVNFP